MFTRIPVYALLVALLLVLAACHEEDNAVFHWVTPEPESVVTEPVSEPEPCELVIKGNISASGEKIAHSPGQANYETTRIDEAAGEKLFCTLEEAEAEGWRAARN